MPSLASLLPLALLPAAVIAAPVSPNQPGIIRLAARTPSTDGLTHDELVERATETFARLVRAAQHKAERSARSLEKRGTTASVPITKHVTPARQVDTHAGNIIIGGQTLPVLFDTGSDDLIMPVGCKSGCPNGFLVTANSPTFKNVTESLSVVYGTGYVEGYLAEDTVSVGGLTVKNQAFAAATNVQTANSENWAGIMGMSPGGGRVTGEDSFIQRLIVSGALAANQFAISLGTEILGNQRQPASLVLGGVDTTNVKQSFVQVANYGAQAGQWLAFVEGYTIDNKIVDSTPALALVDSGSSFNAIPRSAAAALAAGYLGKLHSTHNMTVAGITAETDLYTLPCKLPRIRGFPGLKFADAPTAVSMAVYDTIYELVDENVAGLCFSSFFGVDIQVPGTGGMNGALLGIPFLKSVQTVFSFDNDANGIAMSFSGATAPV
ncbi:hypothetical protein JCM3770_002339 [Rhodotorula araucariae]